MDSLTVATNFQVVIPVRTARGLRGSVPGPNTGVREGDRL